MEYLATVDYTRSPPLAEKRWTRLRPHFRSHESHWIPISEEEVTDRFPDVGLVFWWDSPPDAEQIGSGWVISVEDNRAAAGDDKLRVTRGHAVCQLEQFPEPRSSTFRRRCVLGTLNLANAPLGSVLAQLPGDASQWVGPLKFSHWSPSMSFRGPKSSSTGFINVYEINIDQTQHVTLSNGQVSRVVRLPRPGQRVEGMWTGYYAVQDDEHLLSGVVKKLQQLDGSPIEWLNVTHRAAQEYSARLVALGVIGDEAKREEARLEAAREVLDQADLNMELLKATTDTLFSRADVQDRVKRKVEEAVGARLLESETRFNAREVERQQKIERLDLEIREKREVVQAKETQLQGMEEQMKERLEAAVERIVREPIARVADSVVVRALVASASGLPAGKTIRSTARSPDGSAVPSLESLLVSTRIGAKSEGLLDRVCLSGVAAMLSGTPVLACGADSIRLCRMLGSLVSAGLVWEVCVPTATFGLEDLLSLPAVAISKPYDTTQLGTLLADSAKCDHVSTVIFRGLNRAPLEVAFEDLLPTVAGFTSWPLVPWSGGHDRPAEALSVRVHLLGTLSEGPSCFPISSELLSRVAILSADRDSGTAPSRHLSVPRMHATFTLWNDVTEFATREGRNVAVSCPYIDGQGLMDEYHIYAAVLGTGETAATEWLLSRRVHVLEASEWNLSGLPQGVREAANSLIEAGALDGLRRHMARD